MEQSLYERLGGSDAVMAAVQLFYEKVMADEELASFFEGIDIPRQVDKQAKFMTLALGGPNDYTGRELFTAHRRLVLEKGLSDTHFDAVLTYLAEALEELGIDASMREEVGALVDSTREHVLRSAA